MDKITFSVEEAAAAMGVSKPTMYALCRQPGFPAVRVGRKILIPRASLDAWLREQIAKGGE